LSCREIKQFKFRNKKKKIDSFLDFFQNMAINMLYDRNSHENWQDQKCNTFVWVISERTHITGKWYKFWKIAKKKNKKRQKKMPENWKNFILFAFHSYQPVYPHPQYYSHLKIPFFYLPMVYHTLPTQVTTKFQKLTPTFQKSKPILTHLFDQNND